MSVTFVSILTDLAELRLQESRCARAQHGALPQVRQQEGGLVVPPAFFGALEPVGEPFWGICAHQRDSYDVYCSSECGACHRAWLLLLTMEALLQKRKQR